MQKLLEFLAKYCECLFLDHQFKIVDSEASQSFGNAYIKMISGNIILLFIRDRGQIMLDFGVTSDKKKQMFSIDLVYILIKGERIGNSLLNERYVEFICKDMLQIKDAFSEGKWSDTATKLHKFALDRSKRIFG
jgi:hypothetical protein